MVDYVVRQGHFDPTVLWYQNWPGTFILSATVVTIGSIQLEPLVDVSPLFTQLLCLLPLYVFLKNTLGEARSNYWWVEGQLDAEFAHYVAISRQDRECYRFFLGMPGFIEQMELKLETAVNYDLIYDSVDLKLYTNENIEAAGEK